MANRISLNIQQKQQQSLKQTQRMMMSAQMQQAIKLLQLPIQELAHEINLELEQNPVLELSEEKIEYDDDKERLEESISERELNVDETNSEELDFEQDNFDLIEYLNDDYDNFYNETENYSLKKTSDEEKLKTFLENSLTSSKSLAESLMDQAKETFEKEEELQAATVIIGSLDDNGFFHGNLKELSVLCHLSYSILKTVLEEIQLFAPPGIAAKNLQNCLLMQLKHKKQENTLAYRILENYFEELKKNKIKEIAKELKVSPRHINETIKNTIAKLDLRPGASFIESYSKDIVPDLYIYLDDNEKLNVSVTDDFIPELKINHSYLKMIKNPNIPEETKEFIRKKITSARWLMKNILQRNSTLSNIGHLLIETQQKFFKEPNGKLVPMTMKVYAQKLHLHESTITRAIFGKYLSCDRGIFPLRYFFTSSLQSQDGEELSSNYVKQVIEELIESENKRFPLSDDALSELLKEKGVFCARRTVTKYRSELQLGNVHERRQYL